MSLAYAQDTVPAFPLGQPEDGRDRYGMTPEQACVYRWLVKHRPHDQPFAIGFSLLGRLMMCSKGNAFQRVSALVERGWLDRDAGGYRLVKPIRQFKEPRY